MPQTAIWIDHEEARIFNVEGRTFDEHTVHAVKHHIHRHPQHQLTKDRNHPDDERRFFADVLAALAGCEALLVMGPSVTKLHFLRYAQGHAPALAARVVGLETADHPTDRQVAAHIRHYFHSDSPRLGVAP